MADSQATLASEAEAEPAAEAHPEAVEEEAPPTQEEEAAGETATPEEAPAAPEGEEGAAPDDAPVAPAEEEGQQPEGEAGGDDAKSTGEEGAGGEGEGEGAGEGGEQVEGEQQADPSAQPVEPSDGVDGEPTEGVGVEPTEGVEQTDGGEPSEPAEGGEPVPVEGAEPSEQTEEGETTAADASAKGAEKPEGEEEEEGGDKAEKPEGEEEEPKEGEQAEGEAEVTEQEQVDGEAPKEPDEEAPEAPAAPEEEVGESIVEVGERLSREQTPEVEAVRTSGVSEQERLEATTPEKIGETAEEVDGQEQEPALGYEEEMMVTEDMLVEEPHIRREDLIDRYHEALAEREQLQQQNYSLQHKLAEYFRKKKADERQDYDKNVTDQEQRYLKYMAQLEDLRRQDSMEKENYRAQIEDAKERCQEKKEKVDAERKKFMEFKQHVALNAINSRSGKPIPPKDIEQYMLNEVKKEQEVVNVRLENIKLKNKLKKKEQQLKSKEELAEGLHLIDFEQLKIENQTYNEKIEERNEELLKLRKKITSTVQVLTHLKEKLQFVQGENLEQNNQLKEVEASLGQSRDILSRTKQARDALRIDNQRLRQSCGLLGNEPLLRDFEERKDEGDDLRGKLEKLKMQHAELTLHCNQVRRKIDQVKQSMA